MFSVSRNAMFKLIPTIGVKPVKATNGAEAIKAKQGGIKSILNILAGSMDGRPVAG
ncbi:hypothetical protein CE91St42_27460 [Oscillospiraceae bacterium]|nr:hypothetical protein CE91St42_27460 [Oscillospiraceae bacterium]